MRQEYQALANETVLATQRRAERGSARTATPCRRRTALQGGPGASRAEGEFRKARAVLVYTLGLPADAGVTLDDAADGAAADLRGGLHDELHAWLERARERHPAILAAQAQLAAARDRVDIARSEGRPSIDLTANVYQNGRPNQGLSAASTRETLVGISLNIPLFDGFARHYKARRAGAGSAKGSGSRRSAAADPDGTCEDACGSEDGAGEPGRVAGVLDAAQDALASVRRKFAWARPIS